MGLMLDTSVLIADERGKFDMPGMLARFPDFARLFRQSRPQKYFTVSNGREIQSVVPADNDMWSKFYRGC